MKINAYIDATILKPEAKREAYQQLCTDAIAYQFPAVCVPPFMVKDCRMWLANSTVKTATVIGFPAGYQTIPAKINELREAISLGAEEIDYVVHRGYLANNDWENIEEETLAWTSICKEKGVVSKWIIESSALELPQIEKLLEIANALYPDYVKSSTGVYGKAVLEHIKLFRKKLNPSIKIKAAGGIADKDTAIEFIDAGADRIGISGYQNMI